MRITNLFQSMNNKLYHIADMILKELAKPHIKVYDTNEGKSALRYWYVEAQKMLEEYEKKVKDEYENSTM